MNKMKKRFGFTLMETVVVIGVVGLIIPVIFSIIYSIIRQQTKVYVLSQVKREGDSALNIISTLIRNNAVSVHNAIPTVNNKICDIEGGWETPQNMYFMDKDGEWFRFYEDSLKIASDSSTFDTPVDLTSSLNSKITNFVISCKGISVSASPLISISFNIKQPSESVRQEDTASLDYQTKIKLRLH